MGQIYTNSRGEDYYLYRKTSELKGGPSFSHYFYSDATPDMIEETASHCDLPDDRETVEDPDNGLPYVRKKK